MQWQTIILMATEAMNNEAELKKQKLELEKVNHMNRVNLKQASDEIENLRQGEKDLKSRIEELKFETLSNQPDPKME